MKYDGLDQVIADLGDFKVEGEKDGYTLLSPYGVMRVLNFLGGKHGIGRVDIVENRFVGMKSRGIYETPGGTIILAAHRDLETLTIDREAQYVRDDLITKYSQLVYNGFWFAPEREAIQVLVTETQKTVTGEVRLKLYKGIVSRQDVARHLVCIQRMLLLWKVGQRKLTIRMMLLVLLLSIALRLKASARQSSEG